MNKKELIESVKSLNKLRSMASWNKMSKEELLALYNEGIEVGAIKSTGEGSKVNKMNKIKNITENKEKHYTIIKLNYEKIVTNVKWAGLNKNNTLDEYKRLVEFDDWDFKDCIVKQIVYVSNSNWNYLTDSFLEDNDLWNKIGGHDLDKSDMETFKKFFPDDVGKERFFNLSKEAQDFFRRKCKAEVTELINTNTGETIYINSEGFNYARYVGVC